MESGLKVLDRFEFDVEGFGDGGRRDAYFEQASGDMGKPVGGVDVELPRVKGGVSHYGSSS